MSFTVHNTYFCIHIAVLEYILVYIKHNIIQYIWNTQ